MFNDPTLGRPLWNRPADQPIGDQHRPCLRAAIDSCPPGRRARPAYPLPWPPSNPPTLTRGGPTNGVRSRVVPLRPGERTDEIALPLVYPANRGVGDPGLEPGTSSLSEKLRVASSRPNSQLIPANVRDGARGRRLETTGRYNLVAPPWPHGPCSRAARRWTPKRTSSRRYDQTRTLRRRAAARL
jgi:hypothetical protein